MSTTIQVAEETAEKLRLLKDQHDSDSMDEVIDELIQGEQQQISMFGADSELDTWSHDDRAQQHDRDR